MEHVSWNPWYGCQKVSEGCRNCFIYAMDSMWNKDSSEINKTKQFDLPVRKSGSGKYKIKPHSLVLS